MYHQHLQFSNFDVLKEEFCAIELFVSGVLESTNEVEVMKLAPGDWRCIEQAIQHTAVHAYIQICHAVRTEKCQQQVKATTTSSSHSCWVLA